jgi:hypothetical protein
LYEDSQAGIYPENQEMELKKGDSHYETTNIEGERVIFTPESRKGLRGKNKKNCLPEIKRPKSVPADDRKTPTLQGLRSAAMVPRLR